MWKKEDEEKYWDLKIIHNLLKPKRTVKGDLVNDTYIKEKKVEFQSKSFFNNEISFYLPEGREDKHYGDVFLYTDNMGEYVEYVSMDEEFIFTVEKCKDNSFNEELLEEDDYEDIYEKMIGKLEEKYYNAIAIYWEKFLLKEINTKVYVIEVVDKKDNADYKGLIYCLSNDKSSYRFYVGTNKNTLEVIDELGSKIVKKMTYYTRED